MKEMTKTKIRIFKEKHQDKIDKALIVGSIGCVVVGSFILGDLYSQYRMALGLQRMGDVNPDLKPNLIKSMEILSKIDGKDYVGKLKS